MKNRVGELELENNILGSQSFSEFEEVKKKDSREHEDNITTEEHGESENTDVDDLRREMEEETKKEMEELRVKMESKASGVVVVDEKQTIAELMKENEKLKKRVEELEKMVQKKREKEVVTKHHRRKSSEIGKSNDLTANLKKVFLRKKGNESSEIDGSGKLFYFVLFFLIVCFFLIVMDSLTLLEELDEEYAIPKQKKIVPLFGSSLQVIFASCLLLLFFFFCFLLSLFVKWMMLLFR